MCEMPGPADTVLRIGMDRASCMLVGKPSTRRTMSPPPSEDALGHLFLFLPSALAATNTTVLNGSEYSCYQPRKLTLSLLHWSRWLPGRFS